jgi:hypothetical protein
LLYPFLFLSQIPAANTGHRRQPPKKNGSRLPGMQRAGRAQLSILETALWPLDFASIKSPLFESTFAYSMDDKTRREATVKVRSVQPLHPTDEFFLWGLLGLTLEQGSDDNTLLATPYWMLRKLGMPIGGMQYLQLRQALERLAGTSYFNSAFYNPVEQQRQRVTFHFLSLYLPTVSGRGELTDNERLWRIEWSRSFYEFCRATGGSLVFDLDLYRKFDPATRRLFLKLKDRFWRGSRVYLEVSDLTIRGLGFSSSRPLAKRKYDLTQCMQKLLDADVICLGRGKAHVNELFIKKGQGKYVATFYKGPYFDASPSRSSPKADIKDDALFEPLQAIGFSESAIAHLLSTYARGAVHRWIQITEVAMRDGPKGFSGFRISPARRGNFTSRSVKLPWKHGLRQGFRANLSRAR